MTRAGASAVRASMGNQQGRQARLALVLLSIPAWITWPFLGNERRTTVLEFVDRIVKWTKALGKSG